MTSIADDVELPPSMFSGTGSGNANAAAATAWGWRRSFRWSPPGLLAVRRFDALGYKFERGRSA